jgi:hypothetical protein
MFRIAIASLLLVPSIAIAQEVSGDSNEFAVAVDRDTRTITGYYNSATGYDDETKSPRFTCIFYLRGKAEGKPPYKIVTWFPADRSEVIDGTLEFSGKSAARSVTIRLKEEHGGCWNVQQFATKDGATLMLDRTGTWSSVRVAAARKTHFYSSASTAQVLRSFVTTGDALKVSSTKPGWVQATFTNGDNKSTQGWIREADLFPSTLAP